MSKKDINKKELSKQQEVVSSSVQKKEQVQEEKQEKENDVIEVEIKDALTQLPGVGEATAQKLREAGFDNYLSLAVVTPAEISNLVGLTESAARKVINAARSSLKMGFESGTDLLEKRKSVIKIKTGSSNFDQLLDGGFETGAIVECFGEYGSGKTQVAHLLAVTCQKQDDESVAVYLDTESTFRPERIVELAKGVGLDSKKVLQNIKVARAFNSDHQMLLVEKVEELIKNGTKVRVIIVDSLTAHFRAEFIGRGTLAERQQKLNKHMHQLSKLAEVYNVCVYVTNQVMAKPDTFFGDPTTAIGGNIVGHNSTFRIYLRKGKKGSRVAKLVDSPNLPEGEACFFIRKDRLEDF